MNAAPVGVYVHVPFCVQRCTYCDFNTYAGLLALRPAYVRALQRELAQLLTRYGPLAAHTLYFGGGTPSLLDPADIAALIAATRQSLDLTAAAEITLEANPGTLDRPQLDALRAAGVTRLSLGVQSADPQLLRVLGRIHTWEAAVATFQQARAAGFDNLSLDLMYGLPGQALAQWKETLAHVLALGPEHLSLYALTLEEGTPLAARVAAGTWPTPDPDLAAEMYEWASERLWRAGFWQYEISNWARGAQSAPALWALPVAELPVSQHNLLYWRNEPWLALGAGAHGWFGGQRWQNVAHPQAYIAAVEAGRAPIAAVEPIPPALERGETLMMGLRLAEGVTAQRYAARFGVALAEEHSETLAHLQQQGLLHWDGERARLTALARLVGNRVFGAFLPD